MKMLTIKIFFIVTPTRVRCPKLNFQMKSSESKKSSEFYIELPKMAITLD